MSGQLNSLLPAGHIDKGARPLQPQVGGQVLPPGVLAADGVLQLRALRVEQLHALPVQLGAHDATASTILSE